MLRRTNRKLCLEELDGVEVVKKKTITIRQVNSVEIRLKRVRSVDIATGPNLHTDKVILQIEEDIPYIEITKGRGDIGWDRSAVNSHGFCFLSLNF